MKKIRRARPQQADLDITAFMNLMIVLVPVLLLGMVFSQISVIDVKLPAGISEENTADANNKQVELLIHPTELRVNFPQGILLKRIPKSAEGEYDFETLSLVLQEVKRQLREKGIEKNSKAYFLSH
jgi:biopolymer transport protein ExbD